VFVLEAIEAGWHYVSGGVRDVIGKVKAAVRSVLIFASTVFDLVGGAWDWMVNGIGWLGNNLVGAIARLLHLLEWLALHAIPEGLSWVFNKAVGWAKRAVHDARRFLEGALHQLASWAAGELHKLTHWVTSEAARIWRTLTSVWNFIEHTAKRAIDLVLHPDKLAAWVAGAIVLPVLKWLISSSAGVIVWLARRAISLMPELAHTLEDALAKLI
jgi:hypothetical protein